MIHLQIYVCCYKYTCKLCDNEVILDVMSKINATTSEPDSMW